MQQELVRERRERLKRTHVAVVHAVVQEVAARVPASVDRTALERAGLAALDGAAKTYDVESGTPFASYVRERVRRALVDLLRSHDWSTPSAPAPTADPMRLGFVAAALEQLPDRLALVVRGYFIEQRTTADLADVLGVSEARVSQLRAEALVLLRDAVNVADAAPVITSISA